MQLCIFGLVQIATVCSKCIVGRTPSATPPR